MRWSPLLLLLAACGPKGSLSVDPASVAFGEVDFQQAKPDEGFVPTEVTLTNSGESDLDLVIAGFDPDHLLLGARLVVEEPPTLDTLGPGQSLDLTLAVWDYLPGERDTLVQGTVAFESDDLAEAAQVDWSFTPIRTIDDTGD